MFLPYFFIFRFKFFVILPQFLLPQPAKATGYRERKRVRFRERKKKNEKMKRKSIARTKG